MFLKGYNIKFISKLKPRHSLEHIFLTQKPKTMKQFLKSNWYRVMISISAFTFSVGFFINSITPAIARSSYNSNETISNKNISGEGYEVVVSGGYAYLVHYWGGDNKWIDVSKKVQLK